MNITRIFALIAVLFCSSVSAFAQNTLNVYQKDGTITCFSFSSKPESVFSGDDVIVRTTDQEVSFAFASIEKFTFEDGVTPSGIISTRNEGGKSAPIKVYNTNGILLKTVEPTEEGSTEFPLRDLPAGIYIIKNSTSTYKLIKK